MEKEKVKDLLTKLVDQGYTPIQGWNFTDAYVIEALKKGRDMSDLFKIDKSTEELHDFNPSREQIKVLQKSKSVMFIDTSKIK